MTKIIDETREYLIEHYMPRAEAIAKEYLNLGLEEEDLIASAYEGLVLASDKYTKTRSTNLNGKIDNNIRRTIEKNILTFYGIKVNPYQKEHIAAPIEKKIIRLLLAKRDKEKSAEDLQNLSSTLSSSLEEANEMMRTITPHSNIEMRDLESIQNELLDLESDYLEKEQLAEFLYYLELLVPKERFDIWKMRYMDCLLLDQIAAIYNTTKQNIYRKLKQVEPIANRLKELILKGDYEEIKIMQFSKFKSHKLAEIAKKTDNKYAITCLTRRYLSITRRFAKKLFKDKLSAEELEALSYESTELLIKEYLEVKDYDFISEIPIHKYVLTHIRCFLIDTYRQIKIFRITPNETTVEKK